MLNCHFAHQLQQERPLGYHCNKQQLCAICWLHPGCCATQDQFATTTSCIAKHRHVHSPAYKRRDHAIMLCQVKSACLTHKCAMKTCSQAEERNRPKRKHTAPQPKAKIQDGRNPTLAAQTAYAAKTQGRETGQQKAVRTRLQHLPH
jgi:hypothetical protein